MNSGAFHLPAYFDYLATFAWALSGAIVGLRKRFDIVGVFVLALLTSMGGSILRDGVFLQRPPPVLTGQLYLPLILAATFITAALRAHIPHLNLVDQLVAAIDAIGTPAFAVVGMQLALGAGVPLPGVILVGAVSGVGGGVLRDLIVRDIPFILQPGQFSALVVLLACVAFLSFTLGLQLPTEASAWSTIALSFVVRMLTIRYNWRTRALMGE